jgi:hypothetical protein
VGVRLSGEEVNDYGADSILQFQIDRRGMTPHRTKRY